MNLNGHISYLFIIAAVSAVMLWSLLDGCSSDIQARQDLESTIAFLQKRDSANLMKLKIKASDSAQMQQNIMSMAAAEELLQKELEQYKKVNSFLEAKILNKIENLNVSFNEPAANDFDGLNFHQGEFLHKDTVGRYFIRVPKTFDYKDDWASISGTTTKAGNSFDVISMTNEFDATIGHKKQKGLFKRAKPVVELKSYSPYSTISYVNNVTIDDSRSKTGKLLTSRGAFFAYGFLTNTVISNYTTWN